MRPAAHLFYAQEKAEIERCCATRRRGTRSSRCTCCGRRSCSGRTRSAPRTCCRGRSPRSRRGWPAGAAAAGSRCRSLVPDAAAAVHPRGRRRPGAAALRGRRRAARRVQHRRRRCAHAARRRPRARFPAAAVPRARADRRRRRRPAAVPAPAAEWVEAVSHPAIMDTTKAAANSAGSPATPVWDALRRTLEQMKAPLVRRGLREQRRAPSEEEDRRRSLVLRRRRVVGVLGSG